MASAASAATLLSHHHIEEEDVMITIGKKLNRSDTSIRRYFDSSLIVVATLLSFANSVTWLNVLYRLAK